MGGTLSLLDPDVLRRPPIEAFRSADPFPWASFEGLLTPSAFRRLCDDFPSPELFESHVGVARIHGQRPHDRLYLALDSNIFHDDETARARGVVRLDELAPSWQRFIRELESRRYLRFVRALLGETPPRVRYTWHLGFASSEVSPHLDDDEKLATHIFYFNESREWQPGWGGETLVLGSRRVDRMNPDFADFASVRPVPFLDNRSFLFRNGPEAWHGVRPLRAPAGRYRRLFNVVLRSPTRQRSRPLRRLLRPLGNVLRP